MRISTGHMFDRGTDGILRNQTALFKIQNQISSGRRVVVPEDDPVAAAQTLVVSQSKSVNSQYLENQGVAKSQLAILDGNLAGIGDLLKSVRERTVELGNGTLSKSDRDSIAEDLRQRFLELVSLANSRDSEGQYLFSGFQGATRPFSVNSPPGVPPYSAASSPYVTYSGDEGERLLQVDASRQMGISVSGDEVFMRIKQGNGTFASAANSLNTGTGTIGLGSVLDLAKWNSSLIQPQDFRIDFQVDATGIAPVLKYNLIDTASGNSLFTNAPPGVVTAADWKVFTPDQGIAFTGLNAAIVPGGDLGVQVTISGTPNAGDSFTLAASQNQSIFDTFQNLISAASLTIPATPAGTTRLTNELGASIANLDQALGNVLRVRATVGSRLSELDSLGESASLRSDQYDEQLSNLQDLDYASAITELNKRQLQLEAAQRSFVKISGLSLFSILS